MRPGRLPVDVHCAGAVRNHRGISLSFAVCLILGPAIFLAVLAYQGSLADDPSPFDDDPSHHHRDLSQNGPLRFCAYLDEKNHIQAKAGPCSHNETEGLHRMHNAAVIKDFCIEGLSYGAFDIVNCSNNATSHMGPRLLSTPKGLSPHRNHSEIWELEGRGGREEPRSLGRMHASANTPCYTAHPGGQLEPCSKPENAMQPRGVFRSVDGWCTHLGSDGSITFVNNNTCSAAQPGDRLPVKCHECETVSRDIRIEHFECYLRLDHDVAEVVRCAEAPKHPRDDAGNADEPSDQDPSCIIIRPDGTIAVVDCDSPDPGFIGERSFSPALEDMCLEIGLGEEVRAVPCHEDSKSSALLPHELEHLPLRLLDRATPLAEINPNTRADEPDTWISTNRCTKDFCDWVKIPGGIKTRCYAKDDKNPKTPPMPDEALKYTAPYECNVCLELGVHHEDTALIEQYCHDMIAQEELVVKILAAAGGGILLLCVILAIFFEHRRKKHPLNKDDLSFPNSNGRSRKRSGRTPVMPTFDGMIDLHLSLTSITASQNDAPEIHIASPPRSVILERGVKVPVMPTAQSLQKYVPSPSEAPTQMVKATSSQTPASECQKEQTRSVLMHEKDET